MESRASKSQTVQQVDEEGEMASRIMSDKSNPTNVRVCSGTILIWRRALLIQQVRLQGISLHGDR